MFGSAYPSDTSEVREVRTPGQGKSLLAGVQVLWEALVAAGSMGWVHHMAGHASSLPGPLGLEAGRKHRKSGVN